MNKGNERLQAYTIYNKDTEASREINPESSEASRANARPGDGGGLEKCSFWGRYDY